MTERASAGPGGATAEALLVVITGFMGTGKSETAAALAEILGLDLADTDRIIEERTGRTIPEIFRKDGEERFRALEAELCEELAGRQGLVVATGGGMLVDEQNFARFDRRGTIVLLEASVAAILSRVGGGSERPLLHGAAAAGSSGSSMEERVREVLDARKAAYGRISLRVDTTHITSHQAACRIAAMIDLPRRSIRVRVPAGSLRPFPGAAGAAASDGYEIVIGRGMLSRLGERIAALGRPSQVLVIIPDNVRRHHLDEIGASLEAAELPWREIALRDGDGEKNLDQVAQLLEALADAGAARDSVAVAAGGGVTGDLGGFAAAIYMRGIPLVQVPTTLLAQVDASIGGKVGVNLRRGKNLAGSFYQPHLVLIDPCVLRTLPEPEIANGMAEVIKTAVIGDQDLFAFVEGRLHDAGRSALREIAFLERCAAACAAAKAGIVERDPFEAGERRVLNLGHTLGHAFETLGGYAGLTHGQAVAIGTVAAARIAAGRGLIGGDEMHRIRGALERCGLPVAPPPADEAELLQALSLDKKKRAGRLHFVLPVDIGAAVVVDDVTEQEIRTAVGPA